LMSFNETGVPQSGCKSQKLLYLAYLTAYNYFGCYPGGLNSEYTVELHHILPTCLVGPDYSGLGLTVATAITLKGSTPHTSEITTSKVRLVFIRLRPQTF